MSSQNSTACPKKITQRSNTHLVFASCHEDGDGQGKSCCNKYVSVLAPVPAESLLFEGVPFQVGQLALEIFGTFFLINVEAASQ